MQTLRHHPLLLLDADHPRARRARSIAQRIEAHTPPPMREPQAEPPITPPQLLSLALELAQSLTNTVIELEPEVLWRPLARQLEALRTTPTEILAGSTAHRLLTPHIARVAATYPTTLTLDLAAEPLAVTLRTPAGASLRLDPAAVIDSIRSAHLLPDG